MSGINFLSNNLADNASFSITTGSANAQFPLSNLSLESPSYKFRSVGNTVVIEVDLQITSSIDTFAMVGDPLSGFGATAVSIKTSVTNDFTGATPIPITIYSENNIAYEFITEVSHRYVEITLTGTGSFSEVSNIFIGKRVNLPLNSISVNSFKYRHSDKSETSSNKYGQKFIDRRNIQKIISGQIEFCTKAEFDSLDEIFIDHGRNKPLWMILDPNSDAMNNGAGKMSIYAYFSRYPVWTAVGGQLYTVNELIFEEAI